MGMDPGENVLVERVASPRATTDEVLPALSSPPRTLPPVYGFVFRGRWLVGHIVVVALAFLFIRLGFWQLSRLDEVRAHNDLVRARQAMLVAPLEDLLTPTVPDPGAALYRRTQAIGTYDAAGQVVVRFRTVEGQTGGFVLTPLRMVGGAAVVVNRGFVPLAGSDQPIPAASQPVAGEVRVIGLTVSGETAGTVLESDPGTGAAKVMSTVDLDRIRADLAYDLYPVVLVLQEQDPSAAEGAPAPLPPPDLSEGPHLSYAIQWFLFTAVGLIGWPLLIRQSAPR